MKKYLAATATLALLALSSAASAQQYGRVVTFGDSLSDNGNLFATTGNPPFPYNRRFTNDRVWTEYLFGNATGITTTGPANVNAGNVNLAFGGALSNGAANLNGPIPGTPTQIGTFLALGGRFAANDIVTLWAGANNLLQAPAGGEAAAAVGAAGNVASQVGQLAAAGARNIVVMNLPALGSTPLNVGQPQAAGATTVSNLFNSTLATGVAAAAAANPGANIISVPVDQIFSAILASPGAFGLSNVTQQCIQVMACVGNPAARGSFLFWDGVHPTATGHLIISASVGEYLTAPSRAAAVSAAFGNTAIAARRTTTIDGMAQLSAVTPAQDKWEYFIYATGEAGQGSGTFANGVLASAGATTSKSHDYRLGGIRFGGLRNVGNGWTVGAMASVSTGTIDGSARKFEADATQIALDALARWRSPQGLFVNLGLGFGVDRFSNYEYRTVGPLKNTGSTNAISMSATTEVGYDVKFGAATLTPQLRATYLRTQLEGFTESGVVAPVTYNGRSIQGLLGAAELKLAYQFTQSFSGYALVGYEGFAGGSASDVKGRLAGNTALPFSYKVDDLSNPGVIVGAGGAWNMGSWTARANYRASIGDKSQVRHSANINLGMKF
ncbi:MAG: autotransporter domain-containing protein [Beijerinckiaceae bacterium]